METPTDGITKKSALCAKKRANIAPIGNIFRKKAITEQTLPRSRESV